MKTARTLAALAFSAALIVGCDRESNSGTGSDTSSTSSGRGASTDTSATASQETPPRTNSYDADNTGLNQRDRSGANLTAQDQGGSDADRAISREIRRSITSSDQFSANAKNVKIIAQNGKVTLRGPVESVEEQQAIEAAAKQISGVTSVDNQLEVKQNKNNQ